MKLVTTFYQQSAVVQSLKCRLTDQQDEHLIFARPNRLEVFTLGAEGLRHECDLEIWGRVIALRAVPIPASRRCNLLVLLDHPDPELLFLTYKASDTEPPGLQKTHSLSLYERASRSAEYCIDVLVHPSGKLAVVSCYAGKLTFVFFKNGAYQWDAGKSISEIGLLSICFLDWHEPTNLAILHYDHKCKFQLTTYELNINMKVCTVDSEQPSAPLLLPAVLPSTLFSFPDAKPQLIPIPPQSEEHSSRPGGVLVVGGSKILFFEVASGDALEDYQAKQERQMRRTSSRTAVNATETRGKDKGRDDRGPKPSTSVIWPWSNVAAWCEIDRYPGRYLIGDIFGRLVMLSLATMETNGLVLLPLGTASPASCLTYLTTQVLFLGSHIGESQLLRIESTPISSDGESTLPIPPQIKVVPESHLMSPSKGKMREHMDATAKGTIVATQGRRLTVLQSFESIAPILDAILADTDASGQPSIVTCSGYRNFGSINVIRKGADFEELAVIDGLPNVTGIWPIRALFEDELHTHILVSTLQETMLMSLESKSTAICVDTSSTGFISDQHTLAAVNVPRPSPQNGGQIVYTNSSLVVQVTTTAVALVEFEMALDTYAQVGQLWTLEAMAAKDPSWKRREIVSASVNPTQVLLGLNDSRLALLSLNDKDELYLVALKDFYHHEIAAVSCLPLNPAEKQSQYFVVGFWVSNRVDILSLTDNNFDLVCSTNSLPALPRSVLLHDLTSARANGSADSNRCLFVGLSDGTLTSYMMKDRKLTDEKMISLGDAPVFITVCEIEKKRAIFACGSRAATVYWDKDRLQHSPVLLKDAVISAQLNTRHFPSCLVMSSENRMFIGKVRDINKMHIRRVSLGLDNPQLIVHHPELKVFAVACLRTEPTRVCDDEKGTYSLRLLDDTKLNHVTQFNFEADEEISALEVLKSGDDNTPSSHFCVGTYKYRPDEQEPSIGHIRVFDAQGAEMSRTTAVGLQLTPVTSIDVNGCVFALANFNGMIAAAIGGSVAIFTFTRTEVDSVPVYTIERVAIWNHNYNVKCLVSRGGHLILGDAITSISVLKLIGTRLFPVARDYRSMWPISIAAFDDQTVIGANIDSNFFSFSLQKVGSQIVLEKDGGYNIDECVSKFVPGQLTSPDASGDLQLAPKQLFFAASGTIGIVMDVGHELSLELTALQRNMASVLEGVGGSNHTIYRAPRNRRGCSDAEPSVGFLDGDFLEKFLTQSPEMLKRIQEGQSEAERLTMPLSRIQRVLETLQSMH